MPLHATFHELTLSIIFLIFWFDVYSASLKFFVLGLNFRYFESLGKLFATALHFEFIGVLNSGLAHGKFEREAAFVEEGFILKPRF